MSFEYLNDLAWLNAVLMFLAFRVHPGNVTVALVDVVGFLPRHSISPENETVLSKARRKLAGYNLRFHEDIMLKRMLILCRLDLYVAKFFEFFAPLM